MLVRASMTKHTSARLVDFRARAYALQETDVPYGTLHPAW